jgi:hypothetical protein
MTDLQRCTGAKSKCAAKLGVRPSDTFALQKIQKIFFNGQGKKQGHASGWRLSCGEEVSFSLFGCPKQDEIEMEAGAWAQWGLVPAWKGEVVHPGAPESQCVYKIWQFAGSCQCSL